MNMRKLFLTSLVLVLPSIIASAQNQITDTNETIVATLHKEIHDAATWGPPTTNGLQLRAAVFSGSNGVKQFRVYTYLYDETNGWFGHFPPNGYRISLSLKGADGKEVEKTKGGRNLSKPVDRATKTQMWLRTGRQGGADFMGPNTPRIYENPFNLLDCFKVVKPGTNTLTVG